MKTRYFVVVRSHNDDLTVHTCASLRDACLSRIKMMTDGTKEECMAELQREGITNAEKNLREHGMDFKKGPGRDGYIMLMQGDEE